MNLLTMIVLALLLEPQDFGLVGMVTASTSFLGYFAEFGLLPSLIQKKEVDQDDCNTVFWSCIFFSTILYIVVFLSAPLLAIFYGESRLVLLTRVAFINFLVAPLCFLPEALEIKKIDYTKIAIADLISAVLSAGTAVILALLKFGVWSLIGQTIVMTLSRGILLIVLTGWYPSPYFSFVKFKQLFRPGIHFTIRNLVQYFSENIDFLLVGKLLGPTALGLYTMAFRISKYAFAKLWGIIGTMLFPVFSSFSDDLPRVRHNFIRVSLAGGILLVPALIALFCGLDSLVPLVIGKKWLDAIPVVRVLITYVIVASFSCADDPLMMALNELKAINLTKVLASIVLLIAGYIGIINYNIIGMAAAFTIVFIMYTMGVKMLLLKKIFLGWCDYFRNLKPALYISVFSFVTLNCYRLIVYRYTSHVEFLIGEAIVLSLTLALFFIKYKAIDMRSRTIDIDRFMAHE